DRAAHAAHHRGDFLAFGKAVARIGSNFADTLDPRDVHWSRPLAGSEIGLGAIEAERFYFDDDMTVARLRYRALLNLEDFRPACLLECNSSHGLLLLLAALSTSVPRSM